VISAFRTFAGLPCQDSICLLVDCISPRRVAGAGLIWFFSTARSKAPVFFLLVHCSSRRERSCLLRVQQLQCARLGAASGPFPHRSARVLCPLDFHRLYSGSSVLAPDLFCSSRHFSESDSSLSFSVLDVAWEDSVRTCVSSVLRQETCCFQLLAVLPSLSSKASIFVWILIWIVAG
jgi:hypothetical protein